MTYVVRGGQLVRTGTARYGDGTCDGRAVNTHDWAYEFLRGRLAFDVGPGDLSFNLRTALVTFQYEGAASSGQPTVARSDRGCMPAHVVPFSCGTFRSSEGTGTLAFLGTSRYRLIFDHTNGELTASLFGVCNSISTALQVDGSTVFASNETMSLELCLGPAGTRDTAVMAFFRGVLHFAVHGDTITFATAAWTVWGFPWPSRLCRTRAARSTIESSSSVIADPVRVRWRSR